MNDHVPSTGPVTTPAAGRTASSVPALGAIPVTAAFDGPSRGIALAGPLREALPEALATATAEAFAEDPHADVVLGARPFAQDMPALLVAGALAAPETAPGPDRPRSAIRAEAAAELPAREEFERRVEEVVSRLGSGDAQKVVLGRRLRLPLTAGADPERLAEALFSRLGRAGDSGYGFRVPLPGGGALVGRSPELLIRRRGRRVESCPLAGSAPRTGDPAADEESRGRLLASAKDRREHALVVDDVMRVLGKVCQTISAPPEPLVFETASMLHLGTPISGRLGGDPAVLPGAFELAELLHPTPAVCGTPTGTASRIIADLEEPRGYFTGLVGWQDRHGDGECAVTIRCAEIGAQGIEIYAGAGVISDSRAEAEADETAAKMRTVLRALDLEEELL